MADEPGRLPPGVDLVALAGLVAPLIGPQVDAEAIARRCAEEVLAQLRPLVERMEAVARAERRSLGPYVPPTPGSTN